MTAAVRPATAFAVATLGIAVFSIMDALMKGLTLQIGAYNALLWRSLAGALLAGIPYLWQRHEWPRRSTMWLHVERGCVGAVMAVLFFWGLARVPMAQAVALTFIAPLLALFLAALLLGERVDRRAIFASFVAFAGVLTILAGQARAALGEEALAGTLAILVSAVCYAYNIILMRRQALVARPLEVALFQNLVVGVVLALAAPLLAAIPEARHVPGLLVAAGLATASLLLLSWAYGKAEASYLAPVEYTAFIWASILGYVTFGEAVSVWTVGGALLIAGGCLLAARRPLEPMANLEAAS